MSWICLNRPSWPSFLYALVFSSSAKRPKKTTEQRKTFSLHTACFLLWRTDFQHDSLQGTICPIWDHVRVTFYPKALNLIPRNSTARFFHRAQYRSSTMPIHVLWVLTCPYCSRVLICPELLAGLDLPQTAGLNLPLRVYSPFVSSCSG